MQNIQRFLNDKTMKNSPKNNNETEVIFLFLTDISKEYVSYLVLFPASLYIKMYS